MSFESTTPVKAWVSIKLNLNSFDEAERQEAVDEVKSGVDEAYEIGAKGLAFLSGTDPGGQERQQAIKLLVSSA